jgi:hypothetical protein
LQQRGLSSKVPLRPPGSEISPEKSRQNKVPLTAVGSPQCSMRSKAADAMLYAFDLLELNGKDPLSGASQKAGGGSALPRMGLSQPHYTFFLVDRLWLADLRAGGSLAPSAAL